MVLARREGGFYRCFGGGDRTLGRWGRWVRDEVGLAEADEARLAVEYCGFCLGVGLGVAVRAGFRGDGGLGPRNGRRFGLRVAVLFRLAGADTRSCTRGSSR